MHGCVFQGPWVSGGRKKDFKVIRQSEIVLGFHWHCIRCAPICPTYKADELKRKVCHAMWIEYIYLPLPAWPNTLKVKLNWRHFHCASISSSTSSVFLPWGLWYIWYIGNVADKRMRFVGSGSGSNLFPMGIFDQETSGHTLIASPEGTFHLG